MLVVVNYNKTWPERRWENKGIAEITKLVEFISI